MSGKVHRPIELEFKKVGNGTYHKYNPVLMLHTLVMFEHVGDVCTVRVQHWQPEEVTKAIIDHNVDRQNSWKGRYGDDLVTQTTCLPQPVHKQIMKQCGWEPKHGYDHKKFRQILNDRDNYKLKTVPGKI